MENHRVCYACRKNKHANKQNLAEGRQAKENSFLFEILCERVATGQKAVRKSLEK